MFHVKEMFIKIAVTKFAWRKKGFLNKNFPQSFSATRRDLIEKNVFNFGVRIWLNLWKNHYGDSKLSVKSVWVIYKVEETGHFEL